MNIIKELENLEERAELVEQLRQEQLPLECMAQDKWLLR